MRRLRVYLLLLLALLALSVTVSAEVVYTDTIYYIDLVTGGNRSEVSLAAEGDALTFNENNPGYGGQLTDPLAKAAYDALVSGIANGSAAITVPLPAGTHYVTDARPAISAAYTAFTYDMPRINYVNMVKSSYSAYEDGRIVSVTLIPTYIEDYAAKAKLLDQTVGEFTGEFNRRFTAEDSVVAKYAYIHDYVCSLTSYNHAAAEAGLSAYPHAYTVFGVLADKDKVVCQGYAMAYKVLCDAVGLDCMLIIGIGGESETGNANHMWNCVRVDRQWYAVDVTWDDEEFIGNDYVSSYGSADFAGLELHTAHYTYFMDNSYFVAGDSRDHIEFGNINPDAPTFGLPTLSSNEKPADAPSVIESVIIKVNRDDLTLGRMLGLYNSYMNFNSVTNITIELQQNVALNANLSIPDNCDYTITSAEGETFSITGGTGNFTGSGSLWFDNVLINEDTLEKIGLNYYYDAPQAGGSGLHMKYALSGILKPLYMFNSSAEEKIFDYAIAYYDAEGRFMALRLYTKTLKAKEIDSLVTHLENIPTSIEAGAGGQVEEGESDEDANVAADVAIYYIIDTTSLQPLSEAADIHGLMPR